MDMLGVDIQNVELEGKYNDTWEDIKFTSHMDLNANLGNALEITLK